MSDTASEPTLQSYTLSLGRSAEHTITDQGEQAGAQRSIRFHDCKLSSRFDEFEIDGRKVRETLVTADIRKRLSDRPPPGVEPGSVGRIDQHHSRVTLWVSPVAFQQFWDRSDAPASEQPIVFIEGHINPRGLFAEAVIFEPRLSTHPVVRELQRHWPVIARIRLGVDLLACLVAALSVIELIRWLWR